MKLLDTDETILVVTGSGIPAEERDRPLAYWLKGEIDKRGDSHPYRRGIVVGDAWYVENRISQLNPAITIGGPGVNAAARELSDSLPVVHSEEDRIFVQMGTSGEAPKVCLWGADLAATARAVQYFVHEGLLAEMLERLWRPRPNSGGVYV
jgi:hypothetical protein